LVLYFQKFFIELKEYRIINFISVHIKVEEAFELLYSAENDWKKFNFCNAKTRKMEMKNFLDINY